MKPTILLLLLVGLLTSTMACQEDEPTAQPEFLAQVLGQGPDCGDTYLIRILNDSTQIHRITGSYDRVYYADNLPEAQKQTDLLLNIEFRNLREDELYVCTTFGISYRHIFIIDSKKAEL